MLIIYKEHNVCQYFPMYSTSIPKYKIPENQVVQLELLKFKTTFMHTFTTLCEKCS